MGLAQTTKQLLRAYVTIIDTKKFAAQVLQRFEQAGTPLDMTPEQLKDNAIIASFEDKNVIQIDVKNGDGEMGNRIAYAWAQNSGLARTENGKVPRRSGRGGDGRQSHLFQFRPDHDQHSRRGILRSLLGRHCSRARMAGSRHRPLTRDVGAN
jgi:hypothetical protein